jgi:hypothetical protein
MSPLALSGGSLVFIVIVVVVLLGAVAALYSRHGTGITQRPQGAERPEAPGVGEGPSRISSAEDEAAGPPSTERGGS